MTEHSGGAGMTQERYAKFTKDIQQRAGFVKLVQCNFQEAEEFFLIGHLDIREV